MKRWVQLQRFLHQHGLLAKERSRRLDAIGFQWDAADGQEKMPKRRSGNRLVEETPRKRTGSVDVATSSKRPTRRSSMTAADVEERELFVTPLKRSATVDVGSTRTSTKKRRASLLTGGRLQF